MISYRNDFYISWWDDFPSKINDDVYELNY